MLGVDMWVIAIVSYSARPRNTVNVVEHIFPLQMGIGFTMFACATIRVTLALQTTVIN